MHILGPLSGGMRIVSRTVRRCLLNSEIILTNHVGTFSIPITKDATGDDVYHTPENENGGKRFIVCISTYLFNLGVQDLIPCTVA
jgi:hypothetical protein